MPYLGSRPDIKCMTWFGMNTPLKYFPRSSEKQLKNWKRHWKIQLIEQTNPQWHDLYAALLS